MAIKFRKKWGVAPIIIIKVDIHNYIKVIWQFITEIIRVILTDSNIFIRRKIEQLEKISSVSSRFAKIRYLAINRIFSQYEKGFTYHQVRFSEYLNSHVIIDHLI